MQELKRLFLAMEVVAPWPEDLPDAYKDVDAVVRACQEAGLANMVARLKPALVTKG
jgi:RNA-splicing ligase RtcB